MNDTIEAAKKDARNAARALTIAENRYNKDRHPDNWVRWQDAKAKAEKASGNLDAIVRQFRSR